MTKSPVTGAFKFRTDVMVQNYEWL